MSLPLKTLRSDVASNEKQFLQSLITAERVHPVSPDTLEGLRQGLQKRQKRSSATLLREKLNQPTLKRQFQEI